MMGTNGKFWLASIQTSQRHNAGIRPRFQSERRLEHVLRSHDVQNPATCERPLDNPWEQMVPLKSDSYSLRSMLTKNRGATRRSCYRRGFCPDRPWPPGFFSIDQGRSGHSSCLNRDGSGSQR